MDAVTALAGGVLRPLERSGSRREAAPRSAGADFDALYRAEARRVLQTCRYLLGSADEAEDAAQEVFLRARQRFRQFDQTRPFANWILGDLSRLLNRHHCDIADSPVTPGGLAELLELIANGSLSTSLAKTVLEDMYATGDGAADIARAKGLSQISDTGAIADAVAEAIAANPGAVADYLNGKENAARFLMGQVMRLTKGQAQPELALRLVQEGLEASRNAAP